MDATGDTFDHGAMTVTDGSSYEVTNVQVWTTPWQWPYDGNNHVTVYSTPTLPTDCQGEVHVFACAHMAACKCGKTQRTPAPVTCGTCGK